MRKIRGRCSILGIDAVFSQTESHLTSGKSGPKDQVALVTRNPARKPASCSSPLNSAVKSVVKAPFEFRRDLWQPKTRVSWLSCGIGCVILRLAVLIQYRRVRDGKADRQTDGRTHDYDG